jgi:hypothetical protein
MRKVSGLVHALPALDRNKSVRDGSAKFVPFVLFGMSLAKEA